MSSVLTVIVVAFGFGISLLLAIAIGLLVVILLRQKTSSVSPDRTQLWLNSQIKEAQRLADTYNDLHFDSGDFGWYIEFLAELLVTEDPERQKAIREHIRKDYVDRCMRSSQ